METCFSGRPVGKDPSPDPWATGGGGGEVARGSSNREVGGGGSKRGIRKGWDSPRRP